jgi:hypothetical protein
MTLNFAIPRSAPSIGEVTSSALGQETASVTVVMKSPSKFTGSLKYNLELDKEGGSFTCEALISEETACSMQGIRGGTLYTLIATAIDDSRVASATDQTMFATPPR